MKKYHCTKDARGRWYAGPTTPDPVHALWRPYESSRTALSEEAARQLADECCGTVFEVTVTEEEVYVASAELTP